MSEKQKLHPAEQYAADVRDGRVIVCKPVTLAVARYYRDTETATDKGFYFDRKAAERAINFIHKLRHTKSTYKTVPGCFIAPGISSQ